MKKLISLCDHYADVLLAVTIHGDRAAQVGWLCCFFHLLVVDEGWPAESVVPFPQQLLSIGL